MWKLSERSKNNLQGIDERFAPLVEEVLKRSEYDFAIIAGLRTLAESKANKAKGTSFLSDPSKSKHLIGKAIDFAIFKGNEIDWKDLEAYWHVACLFRDVGKEMGIQVRLGADWNGDGNYKDEIARGSYDGGHVEFLD